MIRQMCVWIMALIALVSHEYDHKASAGITDQYA